MKYGVCVCVCVHARTYAQPDGELFLGSLSGLRPFSFPNLELCLDPSVICLSTKNLHSLTAMPLSYFIFNLISYLWAKPGPDHNGRLTRRGKSDVYLCCGVSGIVINFEVLDTTRSGGWARKSEDEKKGELICRNLPKVESQQFVCLYLLIDPSCMNICM